MIPPFPDVDVCLANACGNVFPGAVLLGAQGGRIKLLSAQGHTGHLPDIPVTSDTIFDLASLTKPLVTTLLIMQYVDQQKLSLETSLGDLIFAFQGRDKSSVTIGQLLCHQSGLPAHRPYFEQLRRIDASLRLNSLRQWLLNEPLESAPGTSTVYSDLGFMVLQWVIEHISEETLDALAVSRILKPSGNDQLGFSAWAKSFPAERIAATEDCPWRNRVLVGDVHDDNAFSIGGVSGHAGLFGTVLGVHQLLWVLRETLLGRFGLPGVSQKNLKQFIHIKAPGKRGFGFDCIGPGPSSAGSFFSDYTVGHLGFTGTSFWWDTHQDLWVILLTNRVYPRRDNSKIQQFRPEIHDLVMRHLVG